MVPMVRKQQHLKLIIQKNVPVPDLDFCELTAWQESHFEYWIQDDSTVMISIPLVVNIKDSESEHI